MTAASEQRPFELEQTAAPAIRRGAREALLEANLPTQAVEEAVLVIEELVANAIDHARTPFRLVLQLRGSLLTIGVRDRSARSLEVRAVDAAALRGRGHHLIAALSDRWGCDVHEEGKTVWASVQV